MASERVRRDSLLSDMLAANLRRRSHSISGQGNPAYYPSEETVTEETSSDKENPLFVNGKFSPSSEHQHKVSLPRNHATIHGGWSNRKKFFDDLFPIPPIPPAATIHALRNERRARLDELGFSELSRLRNLSRRTSVPVPPADPLASERMIRMKMIEQYLNEHGAHVVVPDTVPSSSFFKVSFHNHLIDELKKVSHMNNTHWLYWYLHIILKYTGLKHVALTLLLVAYALLGGVIFEYVEYDHEREVTFGKAASVMSEITAFVASLNQSMILSSGVNLTDLAREFYLKALEVDGFTSSIQKLHDDNATWSLESGTFYAMTLLSTIGYGNIFPTTTAGRVITVIYTTLGLPIMLIVIRDLGLVIFLALKKTYNRFHVNRRRTSDIIVNPEEGAMSSFPLPLALMLVYLYLMVMTLIVFFFDEEAAQDGSNGLSLGNCFYFSFISLTTIGLGDVMPQNIHYSPIFAGIFLSGLALISTVNTATYARIERKYFNAMSALERVLEELEKESTTNHINDCKEKKEKLDDVEGEEGGQELQRDRPSIKKLKAGRPPVFHELLAVVRLAALVIPNLENQVDDAFVRSYEALHDDEEKNSRKSSIASQKEIRDRSSSVNDAKEPANERPLKCKNIQKLQAASLGRWGSAPSLPARLPLPSISITVDKNSSGISQDHEHDKRFVVCPVQDRRN